MRMKSKILKHGGSRKSATGKAHLISIKMPREMVDALDEMARKSNVTRSELIRQVLDKGIR